MIEKLKEMCAVQCREGNWNFDPYMHGMANGLIFAVSIMEDKEPVFLDAPKEWGYKRAQQELTMGKFGKITVKAPEFIELNKEG